MIFTFRIDGHGLRYDEINIHDSAELPGALTIECCDLSECCAVDLPREQVEKLVARLTEWLHPPTARRR